VKKYNEVNGYDAGIGQQQFKLIEELEQRLGDVDWDLLQKIDDDMVKCKRRRRFLSCRNP